MLLIIALLPLMLLQPPRIMPDQPLKLILGAGADPVDVVYIGQADEILDVDARSVAAAPIDVTLEILFNGQRIAFNDDQQTNGTDLSPSDAAIENLRLSEAGTYILRIYSFNGAQNGAVKVRLKSSALVVPCAAMRIQLMRGTVYRCQLELKAGQHVTATAHDASGTMDPVLELLDSSGQMLAENDDHANTDLSLDTLDAEIDAVPVPEDGGYQIQVRDFAGRAGTFDLALQISP